MERFQLDDVHDDYDHDALEPMRASSFDMTISLNGDYTGGLDDGVLSDDDDCADAFADIQAPVSGGRTGSAKDERHGENDTLEVSRTDARSVSSGGSLDEPVAPTKRTLGKKQASIASRLEDKAQETMQLASLHGSIPWRLARRMQDVHIYRPAVIKQDELCKVFFRMTCEVKANVNTIMDYLMPSESKVYHDIELRAFPGLLHASVVKKIEVRKPIRRLNSDNNGTNSTNSNSGDDASFPKLNVKWHASRFAGRLVKPADFVFVEYSNVEALPTGEKRGYGYVRSVETFKGDELASRFNSDEVSIPNSVSKCKRAMINKGAYIVTPVREKPGVYEVTIMMIIDFQQQFGSVVAAKIIHCFTERMIRIREWLYKTLSHPVQILSREEWKAENQTKCHICTAQFSLMKPRHHCRSCGEAVCGQCSRKWAVQPGQHARLCTSCSLRARGVMLPPSSAATVAVPLRNPYSMSQPTPTTVSSAPANAFSVSADFTRTEVDEFPEDVNGNVEVRVASVLTTDANAVAAAQSAYDALVVALGNTTPTFMLVTYSSALDPSLIYRTLKTIAPETLFVGHSSCAGVFSDEEAVSDGPGLALWGVVDPEGSYAVLSADFSDETPRSATRRCLLQGMRVLGIEPEENPELVWLSVADPQADVVVKALNEVVDSSFTVVAGSSVRSAGGGLATQLCSDDENSDGVLTNGMCLVMCSPSVEVTQSYFTCYEPKEKSFIVTNASGRDLHMLDHKPALAALNDACHGMLFEYINHPHRFGSEKDKLPLYYPICRQRVESRSSKTSRFQVMQPESVSDELTVRLGVEIKPGEKVRMMSVSLDHIADRCALGLLEAIRGSVPCITKTDVVGCFMSASINYSRLLGDDVQLLAKTIKRVIPGCATVGTVSHGQQGVLMCSTEVCHANGMITALLFTNRKKAIRLKSLKPVLARRFSSV